MYFFRYSYFIALFQFLSQYPTRTISRIDICINTLSDNHKGSKMEANVANNKLASLEATLVRNYDPLREVFKKKRL